MQTFALIALLIFAGGLMLASTILIIRANPENKIPFFRGVPHTLPTNAGVIRIIGVVVWALSSIFLHGSLWQLLFAFILIMGAIILPTYLHNRRFPTEH